MGFILVILICILAWIFFNGIGIAIVAAAMAILWILSKIFGEDIAMLIFLIMLALSGVGIIWYFWGDWWTMFQYLMIPGGIFLYLYLAFD